MHKSIYEPWLKPKSELSLLMYKNTHFELYSGYNRLHIVPRELSVGPIWGGEVGDVKISMKPRVCKISTLLDHPSPWSMALKFYDFRNHHLFGFQSNGVTNGWMSAKSDLKPSQFQAMDQAIKL